MKASKATEQRVVYLTKCETIDGKFYTPSHKSVLIRLLRHAWRGSFWAIIYLHHFHHVRRQGAVFLLFVSHQHVVPNLLAKGVRRQRKITAAHLAQAYFYNIQLWESVRYPSSWWCSMCVCNCMTLFACLFPCVYVYVRVLVWVHVCVYVSAFVTLLSV